jgi:hypothetical protein
MAKYVFSFRVPSAYRPDAGTPAEWQAWFGGLGSALVRDCPALRVGGGVEVGPVLEAAGS